MHEANSENVGASTGADNLFFPSVAKAKAVDAKVRSRLKTSLSWLSETYECLNFESESLDGWFARPADFGLYYDLASAVHHAPETAQSPENLGNAKRLADRILASVAEPAEPESLSVKSLGPRFFDEAETDCLLRWFDLEPENSMALLPLDQEEYPVAEGKLLRALNFLKQSAPEFFGELETLTAEFVFAKPGPSAKLKFGGASSFALWGALALNSEAHPEWWDYLPRLVHEYSHNLLFGLASDSVLVMNDPSERYRSPLRGTMRPIDGIYHACYVSAREVAAMSAILSSFPASLAGEDAQLVENFCQSIIDRSVEAHEDCLAVLTEHADLSELGKRVLDDTTHAMANR